MQLQYRLNVRRNKSIFYTAAYSETRYSFSVSCIRFMLRLLDKLSSKLQKSDAYRNTQGEKEKEKTHLLYNYSVPWYRLLNTVSHTFL